MAILELSYYITLMETKRMAMARNGPFSTIIADHPDREAARIYRNALYRAKYEREAQAERSRVRVYKHANPEAVARHGDVRKQRAATQSDGTLTPSVVRQLFADACMCPYCAMPIDEGEKTLDHKEPLSRGGAHSISNVLICCRRCNAEKHNKQWVDWLIFIAGRVGIGRRCVIQHFSELYT
jgi:5-methylcytosine-specific restriction endonuclease McrA